MSDDVYVEVEQEDILEYLMDLEEEEEPPFTPIVLSIGILMIVLVCICIYGLLKVTGSI